jgi:hypothetical protein
MTNKEPISRNFPAVEVIREVNSIYITSKFETSTNSRYPIMDQEDYTHPEKFMKGVLYCPNGHIPASTSQETKDVFRNLKGVFTTPPRDPDTTSGYKELCRSCGWNT